MMIRVKKQGVILSVAGLCITLFQVAWSGMVCRRPHITHYFVGIRLISRLAAPGATCTLRRWLQQAVAAKLHHQLAWVCICRNYAICAAVEGGHKNFPPWMLPTERLSSCWCISPIIYRIQGNPTHSSRQQILPAETP